MGFSRSFPQQTLRGPKSAPRPRGRWHATATGEPEPAHGGALGLGSCDVMLPCYPLDGIYHLVNYGKLTC